MIGGTDRPKKEPHTTTISCYDMRYGLKCFY
nr:MAG TPA: hypothetical protein [Herelleviridae sp.]